jgi:hypothetical protein
LQTLPPPDRLAELLDISISYATKLKTSHRPWTKQLAIDLWRQTGMKVGPIADATDEQIETLALFESKAA